VPSWRDDDLDFPRHRTRSAILDYRFCWLRDSYFTLHAINRLSATGTMERYLDYIRTSSRRTSTT